MKVGDILYCKDGSTVKVLSFDSQTITVEYNGKSYCRPISILNHKLFEEGNDTKKTCEDCISYRNKTCLVPRETACGDFKPAPPHSISNSEHWPKYGDATAIRLRDRGRFKE